MNATQNTSVVRWQDALGQVDRPSNALQPAREVKRGKGTVLVQGFNTAGKGASEIKAELKAANPKLSAKALGIKVNEVLRGERDVREQLGIAWVQACYQDGLVPSHGERTKGGACLRLKAAPEPKKPVVVEQKPATVESVSEQIAKLQAQLEEMKKAQAGK